MDESTSALDPISTKVIEDLIEKLKTEYTVVIVTHNMAQAKRIADYTAYFYEGEVKEFGNTQDILSKNLFEGMKKSKGSVPCFFSTLFFSLRSQKNLIILGI